MWVSNICGHIALEAGPLAGLQKLVHLKVGGALVAEHISTLEIKDFGSVRYFLFVAPCIVRMPEESSRSSFIG